MLHPRAGEGHRRFGWCDRCEHCLIVETLPNDPRKMCDACWMETPAHLLDWALIRGNAKYTEAK